MGLFDFFKRDRGKEIFAENDDDEKKAQAIRNEIKRSDSPATSMLKSKAAR